MFNKPVDLAGAAAFIAFMAVLPLVFTGNYLIGEKITHLPREVRGKFFSIEGKLHLAIVK